MAGAGALLRAACLIAFLVATQGSRGMCTYVMLDRSGGRWRIPDRCTHLYLTQVQFGAPGARQMAELLRSNPGVTEVDASSCGIKGLSGAAALGDALRNNTVLRRLNLGNNRLGDAGAESIAAGLAVNTALRSLNLAHNRVGPLGAAALARALQANRALTSLDLDLNRLHDEGAVQLAPALRDNDVLATLVLSGNMIGNVGASALADAVAVNRGLVRLHLKYNRISGEGARLLAEAVLQNGRVTVTGPEFLMHTVQRMQLKRKALAEPRNATLLLEVATLYEAGRLSAHKVVERYSQAYCWCAAARSYCVLPGKVADASARRYSMAAQLAATAKVAKARMAALTAGGKIFGPSCNSACVALAEEVCAAPLKELPGPIITHGERNKRWLRREVGGAHHAKDEL